MAEKQPDNGTNMGKKPVTELSRDMGLMHVTMIGVGAMIGAGIFVLTGLAAAVAGPALILVCPCRSLQLVCCGFWYLQRRSSSYGAC